jgi:hypothetical protein
VAELLHANILATLTKRIFQNACLGFKKKLAEKTVSAAISSGSAWIADFLSLAHSLLITIFEKEHL